MASPNDTGLSPVETIKAESRHLRGGIADTIADKNADNFADSDAQLLKFHGVYQQYDRDSATARKQQGLDKHWQMMARLRIPGGRLAAAQYLQLDAYADRFADGSLRITTRQTIQYHGILKGDLQPLLNAVNQAALTTLAACGDVVRNVMAPPAPWGTPQAQILDETAAMLSTALLPTTGAYHEIWVDGEKIAGRSPEEEAEDPLYGSGWLPRKFKIAVGTPDDNTTDVLTNDIGLLARFDQDRLIGWWVCVGGGHGMTHNKPNTYPRMGSALTFTPPEHLLAVVKAIVTVQRDFGDRGDRRHARLKYTIDDHGLDWFRAEVAARTGLDLQPAPRLPRLRIADHMGWHRQQNRRWFLGLPVPSGRIRDTEAIRLRSALREIVARFQPSIVLTPAQDIILADLPGTAKRPVERILRDASVTLAEDLKPVERWALACVALPTCGLALTEAERVRQPIVGAILDRLTAHGLQDETISVRITGCPNGCARPYAGDIGLVGRTPGHYSLFLGGDFEGTWLNTKVLDKVAEADIAGTLDPLFAAFARDRQGIEGFGDFCNRLGPDAVRTLIANADPIVTI